MPGNLDLKSLYLVEGELGWWEWQGLGGETVEYVVRERGREGERKEVVMEEHFLVHCWREGLISWLIHFGLWNPGEDCLCLFH